MMTMESVCKDCQDRYPACWGSCPRYKEARKALEEKKRRRQQARKREEAVNSVRYHGYLQYKKHIGED